MHDFLPCYLLLILTVLAAPRFSCHLSCLPVCLLPYQLHCLMFRFLLVEYITFVMLCAFWYHLYSLKNEENTHGGVLLLIKLKAKPATLLKVTLLHGFFHVF